MKKRLLCLTVALIMIFSLLPMSAFAAGGECGDNLTWQLDSEGVLTISGTGDMWEYVDNDDYCINYSDNFFEEFYTPWNNTNEILTVNIGAGVTGIIDCAFAGCDNLREINVDEGNTAFISLNGVLFNKDMTEIICCPAAKNDTYVIPSGVERIGNEAFYGCKGLTSIIIPESVTSIGHGAFYGCEALTSITIPKNVVNIGAGAFYNCYNIDEVYYNAGNAQVNKYIYVEYPVYDVFYNVGMSNGGFKLIVGENAEEIPERLFEYCYTLKSVTMSDCTPNIGDYAFAYSGIKSIEIPNGVKRIGSYAFYNCSLTSVNIPASVESLSSTSFGNSGLQTICVDKDNKYFTSLDGVLFNKDKTHLIRCPNAKIGAYNIPDGVETIEFAAFGYCDSIISIKIPDSLKYIEDNAFYGCSNLTSVTFPCCLNIIGGGAFFGCDLDSVFIPESVTEIGEYAFCYCDRVQDIYYEGTEEQWEKIIDSAECYYEREYYFEPYDNFYCCDDIDSSESYYCFLKNVIVHYNEDTTNEVTVTKQPTNLEAASGTTGKFSIAADGDGITYQWQYLKPDSTTWTNCTSSSGKTDTLSVNVREAIDGYKYRCVVKDENNKTLTSEEVTLTVLPKVTITKQPVSMTTLNGTSCTFSITATGTGLKYQWQYQKPDTESWINSTSTSAKTDTLTVNARDAINGYMYRCIVKDSAGNTATSNVVSLTVKPYLQISQQPSDLTADSGTVGKFSIKASGTNMTYQWQYQKPNSTAWTNSTASSAKIATFSVNVREAINGYKYRCVVSDGNGNKVTSGVAKLTVMPVLTTQPNALKAASGTSGIFSVTATGDGLTYQWQYQKPNTSTWVDSASASGKTATFSVSVREAINGYKYRCVVTNSCGNKVISDVATLTVIPKITKQPTNLTAMNDTTGRFSISVTGDGLTYQWQYLKPGGSWTNSAAASGKTATFSVNAREAINGYKYRCKVTNSCGNSVTSKTVTLTVKSENEIEIIKLPTDLTAANGTVVKFGIKATGDGISYQWQYQKPGTTTWVNSTATSGTTATFSVNARTAINGYKYRCIVKDSTGNSITSNVVTLTVK